MHYIFSSSITLASLLISSAQYPISRIIYNVFFSPLNHVLGLISWSATRLPFIWALLRGTIVHDFEKMHRKYGPVVRTASATSPGSVVLGRPGHVGRVQPMPDYY